MHTVRAGVWEPQPPSKHVSPLPPPPSSNLRLAHVTTASPAKRITFYKSGDSQFGGVRMAVHKRSFKCFDALLDDLSQKVPLPFGVRTVTTPRGIHAIKHLEQLQDGGCYLCSDRRQAKPVNMELSSKRPGIWYHHSRRPQRPETSSAAPPGHLPYRQRRILLVKNSEPGMRRSVVLSRRSTRSLRAFLDEVSEVMQFHVRKLYTAEGRRIDSVQSLVACPGVLVCVGREAFSPLLVNFISKSSEEKLPGLSSRSPGLGPRTPGNGARSPAVQGPRSPPHGAQSRASEYNEGHESKKNVNFGLETKKSIIHPRSDSSNRSTRFSLSSEKSYGNGVSTYSQARPAIMNEDIEKRVLVNKDGSLSVEMRVRFRLQNDETLQWSTQIKKSPSLTNECCPLSQAQPSYLQQGQSESCSDPDSTSFDPECVDYSNQPLQCSLEGNSCPCCYQRQEQKYDLWENPVHSYKRPPVPPPRAPSHTHTMTRHTHSSSSSSSCNSRRVVRCRAQLSSCRGGSGSEQSQLVQEEMCVTQQVERRVEVEQDGDTHVEVCKVSRCCSRNLRPLSRKSVEDELLMEEQGERPFSTVSSSSRVLQSLKEDLDDDLPPSASQCCHSNEPSPSPSFVTDLNDEPASSVLAGSIHSTDHKEGEERGSRAESAASSCHCGAAEAEEMDQASSSMSKRSRLSCRSSKAKIPNSEEEAVADDEDEELKRVASGLSGHTGLSAGSLQSGPSSVCPNCGGCKRPVDSVSNSRASQRAPSAASATSHRSNRSHKSGCNEEERSPSAISAQSNLSAKSRKSHKSKCSSRAEVRTRQEAEGENAVERALSSLSAKSDASVKLKDDTNQRTPSALSVKSNASVKPDKAERPDSVLSAKSAKSTQSNVSAKSGTSRRSTCSHCVRAVSPGAKAAGEPVIEATGLEEGTQAEARTASAMSAKSNLSAKSHKSHKSTKAAERSLSPRLETGGDGEERTASQMSVKSNLSVKFSKSCKSNCHVNETAESPILGGAEVKENEMAEEETQQRPESVTSTKLENKERAASAGSSKSHKSACNESAGASSETEDNTGGGKKAEDRAASALSGKSASSAKSSPSPNAITIKTSEGVDEEENETTVRAPSAASAKSGKSKVSSASSNHNKTADIAVIETVDADEKVEEDNAPRSKSSEQSCGQMLARKSTRSPRTHSPKAPAVSPSGALSVHSTTPAKSGRLKCCCGAASALERAKKEKEGEDKEVEKKEDNDELKSEEASERPASILSSSTKRHRRESGGTEQPLSRNSSGSVSLGLPDDQETPDSDSGKSGVSFHINTDRRSRVNVANLDVPKNIEQSAMDEDEEGTGSNCNGSKSTLSQNPPAIDIPTIETTAGSEDKSEEGGELKTERTASTFSAKSSRSHKSSCNCSVKAAAQLLDNKSKEQHTSASSTKASNLDAPVNRTSSAARRPASKAKGKDDIADNKVDSVLSKSPCCLKPESAASAHSGSKESKGGKAKSSGSLKTSNSQKKETPIKSPSPCSLHSSRPGSKVETDSQSTLFHSLSAADLLKETMAAARPPSQHTTASKTSDKPRSEKSGRHQRRNRNQADLEEVLDLTPAFLPNASPNEVVSDWLRSIPTDSSMLALGDELNDEEEGQEKVGEERHVDEGNEEGVEQEGVVEDKLGEELNEEEVEQEGEEEKEEQAECDAAEEEKSSDPALVKAVGASSRTSALLLSGESLPRNWQSSAAVMKVLLSSSLGRCQSMPEVSPVYGRRLSTSARGLLDCLAQLQLIDPAVSPCCEQQKDRNQQYEDIMTILQSLWLTEPKDIEATEVKDIGKDQVTPPRSSSGVDMSTGSGGSGKEDGNKGGDETTQNKTKETDSLHEDEGAEKVVEKEEEGNAEAQHKETKSEPEEISTEQAKTDIAEELVQSEEQSTVPPSLDSPKASDNPSSSDKSSANDSSKSPTDNETLEDSSSGTPPTVLRAPLSKRPSQDPDPRWVLHLLKKLEKQFMNHYINAMAEFKVRWDLDDSLILDTMISELREEVSRRIQSSIEREMRKIQGRAGRGGRSPRPPQGGNLSRESTMTDRRRQMLKIMKNQSVKTGDSLSDGEMTGEFSDQRSDDEYCPCDACVRKKMAARPLKTNPMAAEAPVMMEFDLLKILQLKKSPSPVPAAVPQPAKGEDDTVVVDEQGRSLEVLQEEEEEDEPKEDIKADEIGEEVEGGEAGEEEEVGAENEGNRLGDEEQEEEEAGGEEAEVVETSENGEKEGEEETECQCQCARHEEESDKAEESEEGTAEGEDAAETSDKTGEDETAEDEERAGEEEGENAEDEGETGDNDGEEECAEVEEFEEEEETTGRESGEEEATGETEDDEGDDGTGEGESHEDEKGGESEEPQGEASEEERASLQGQGVTEGEEADAEDSDTDKRPSDTSADESGREGAGATGDEEEKQGAGDGDEVVEDAVGEFKPEEEEEGAVKRNSREDGALLHQFTRTSVESQPGSLEEINTDSPQNPVNSTEVPKIAADVSTGGGTGQRRSRSPARVKRRKPRE
ncbi:retinitis pigmentosa 1-like 1 protein [Micropterus dolomieu]|uniref:retinitis pigmentosa 1-like 1 protein n=1 Tax=Micropterus dolomieu TaxID=147949 RepID=UPI001E8E3F95|nr:retinitis pigmentosa 1-like 1 protein [Micropterus dolomieu]